MIDMSTGILAGREEQGSFLRAVTEACAPSPGSVAPWTVAADPTGGSPWIEVACERRAVPAQGWKLHVSASMTSAASVLAGALPVLIGEGATFKVVASPRELERLNHGFGGRSQVGKFLTVYPADDDHAVRLAVRLDRATAGLAGPRIPSDRHLRPGSLVHYRYGSFEPRWMQTGIGDVVPALVGPDDHLVADDRGPMYRVQAWVVDPFAAAGVAAEPPPADLLVAGRYLTVAVLNDSTRTAVRLALDIESGERRVLKHARRRAAVGGDDTDVARLRREADVLLHLAGDPRVPRLHGLVEDGDDTLLVLEHCAGPTLEQRVTELALLGRHLSTAEAVAVARELARLLGSIHRAGLVHGDVKPSNVICPPGGGLRLVDFETVTAHGAPGPAGDGRDDGIVGTLGYVALEQAAGGARTVSGDVHGLGALLFRMLTGADPSDAPDPFDLLARPVRLLRPGVPARLERLVAGCLDADPTLRPASMAEVAAALDEVAARPAASLRPGGPPDHPAPDGNGDDLRTWADDAVRRLAAELGPIAIAWPPPPGEPPRRDIHAGLAGIVLVLAETCGVPGAEVEPALAAGARSLAEAPVLPGGPLPGLYVGEAGVGAALLRAGLALGDDTLVEAAVARGRLVASLPHVVADLHHGSAGRLRFHLALADATGDAGQAVAAAEAGELLLESAGGRWPIPAGHGVAEDTTFLGYAHGMAGIADVLLDLFEAIGDERCARVARDVAVQLAAGAQPALEDGTGCDWPVTDGGSRVGPFWCHGAAGIGRFLFRAAALTGSDGVAAAALGAARAAARGARWAGPGQCHGLAGLVELLLDAHSATGDPTWGDEALDLVRLLRPYLDRLDDPGRLPDGFAGGRAGILACLLRIIAPGPHVMDLRSLGRPGQRWSAGTGFRSGPILGSSGDRPDGRPPSPAANLPASTPVP